MTLVRKQPVNNPAPIGPVEVLWGRGNFCIEVAEGRLRLSRGQLKYKNAGIFKLTRHRDVSDRDWEELHAGTAKLVAGRITHTDNTLVEE